MWGTRGDAAMPYRWSMCSGLTTSPVGYELTWSKELNLCTAWQQPIAYSFQPSHQISFQSSSQLSRNYPIGRVCQELYMDRSKNLTTPPGQAGIERNFILLICWIIKNMEKITKSKRKIPKNTYYIQKGYNTLYMLCVRHSIENGMQQT